jgi:hypothetical protein
MKALVAKDHIPDPTGSIITSSGDVLAFERKPTLYPGWIWCTDSDGNQAWAPEEYVTLIGDTCRFVRGYDSRELEIQQGTVVELLDQTSGWAWVRDSQNRLGWIPLDCLSNPDSDCQSGG